MIQRRLLFMILASAVTGTALQRRVFNMLCPYGSKTSSALWQEQPHDDVRNAKSAHAPVPLEKQSPVGFTGHMGTTREDVCIYNWREW
jgi:hypothetical protein